MLRGKMERDVVGRPAHWENARMGKMSPISQALEMEQQRAGVACERSLGSERLACARLRKPSPVATGAFGFGGGGSERVQDHAQDERRTPA